jgi:hypothetical protein
MKCGGWFGTPFPGEMGDAVWRTALDGGKQKNRGGAEEWPYSFSPIESEIRGCADSTLLT